MSSFQDGKDENIPNNSQDVQQKEEKALQCSLNSKKKTSSDEKGLQCSLSSKTKNSCDEKGLQCSLSSTGKNSCDEIGLQCSFTSSLKSSCRLSLMIDMKEISSEMETISLHRDDGEPPQAQLLRIDFTPIKGLDDDDVLTQKILDFWKVVHESPGMRCITAHPQKQKEDDVQETLDVISIDHDEEEKSITPDEKTCVQWVADLPKDICEVTHHTRCIKCSQLPKYEFHRDSEEEEESNGASVEKSLTNVTKKKGFMLEKRIERNLLTESLASKAKAIARSAKKTKKLCSEMEEFDRKQFKGSGPSARKYSLVKAEMQRLPPLVQPHVLI